MVRYGDRVLFGTGLHMDFHRIQTVPGSPIDLTSHPLHRPHRPASPVLQPPAPVPASHHAPGGHGSLHRPGIGVSGDPVEQDEALRIYAASQALYRII